MSDLLFWSIYIIVSFITASISAFVLIDDYNDDKETVQWNVVIVAYSLCAVFAPIVIVTFISFILHTFIIKKFLKFCRSYK